MFRHQISFRDSDLFLSIGMSLRLLLRAIYLFNYIQIYNSLPSVNCQPNTYHTLPPTPSVMPRCPFPSRFLHRLKRQGALGTDLPRPDRQPSNRASRPCPPEGQFTFGLPRAQSRIVAPCRRPRSVSTLVQGCGRVSKT